MVLEKDVDPRKGPQGDIGRYMHAFRRKIRKDPDRHRLLIAVKAALIAADSVGSALVRQAEPLQSWIDGCFAGDPLTPDWIEKSIIRSRISDIEIKSGGAFH